MPISLKAVSRIKPKRASATMKNAVQRTLLQYTLDVQSQLQKYPPQLPGSRYRRTGNLGRGWKTRIDGVDRASVFNNVDYSAQVEGLSTGVAGPAQDHQTTDMARRQWPAVDKVAKDTLKKYTGQLKVDISVNGTHL